MDSKESSNSNIKYHILDLVKWGTGHLPQRDLEPLSGPFGRGLKIDKTQDMFGRAAQYSSKHRNRYSPFSVFPYKLFN